MKIIFLLPLILPLFAYSQIVETVVINPSVTDGMCTDPSGNIYTTSGGLEGNEVGLYNPTTDSFNPNTIVGLTGPTDVEFLSDSLLIITNYDINTISMYNLNTGDLTTIATGLDGPAGLETGTEGSIYITNWGNAPSYAGHTITKIAPSGSYWTYIDTNILYRPQAITFNHQGLLVVHSNENLYKVNPVDSTLEFWTNLGMNVVNIVFNPEDSCIYGAANQTGKIVKIDTSGDFVTFAGSVPGYFDGDINDAQFFSPHGLTFSPGMDTLYIAEAGSAQRLRRILLTKFTAIEENSIGSVTNIWPNPLNNLTDLKINLADKKVDQMRLYNAAGEIQYICFPEVNTTTLISTEITFHPQKWSLFLYFQCNEDSSWSEKVVISR